MIKIILKVLAAIITLVVIVFAIYAYNFQKELNEFRAKNGQDNGKNTIYSDNFEYPITNKEAYELNRKALNKVKNENFNDALKLLERANEIEQNNPLILSNIGLIYKRQQIFGRAIEYMNQAIEVSDSSYIPAIVNLGTIYMDNKEYLKSIEVFESLVGSFDDPKYKAGLLFNLTIANARLGKCDEAKEWRIQLIEICNLTSQQYLVELANESIDKCDQNI